MRKLLMNAALAALVAVGGVSFMPPAQAQGLYLDLEDGDVGIGVVPEGRSRRDRREERREVRRERVCTPDRAAEKARRLGYRRVEVEDVRRRSIIVSGRKNGRRVDLVFGRNDPRCPLWD